MIDFNEISRLSEEEFARFAKLIYTESGIYLKDTKITLLSNRLRKRLKALGLDSFSEYYDYIYNLHDKSKEIEALIDVVSTNETYFFRNERQFDALMMHCLPDIANKRRDKRRLRIWSAGCSTGEEPYTIGICILENLKFFEGWDVSIIATDIAPSVLDFAKKGEYTGRRIEKVTQQHLQKYFIQNKRNPDVFMIKNDVKKLVKFSTHNLFKDEYPAELDIIFCRNVMIYFDKMHRERLVERFYKALSMDGYLFIGHSETLHLISKDFVYIKVLESPVYIPKESVHEF